MIRDSYIASMSPCFQHGMNDGGRKRRWSMCGPRDFEGNGCTCCEIRGRWGD